ASATHQNQNRHGSSVRCAHVCLAAHLFSCAWRTLLSPGTVERISGRRKSLPHTYSRSLRRARKLSLIGVPTNPNVSRNWFSRYLVSAAGMPSGTLVKIATNGGLRET